ncbi:hypothetical protein ACEPAI_1825 [Sanghuangporus weigelae]
MATSYVQYSRQICGDLDNAAEYGRFKSIHIVLFDRSSMSPDSGSDEIESPVLARFKSTVEEAVKGSGDKEIKVRFAVIRAPQQVRVNQRTQCNMRFLGKLMLGWGGYGEKYMFSAWMEQIKEGYYEVAREYNVYDDEKLRDSVLLFGDGEGAMAAIGVARLINKVGVLEPWAFEEKGTFNRAFKYAMDHSCDEDRLYCFKTLRATIAKVDLLGLWCNDSRVCQISRAVGNDKALREKLVLHNRDKCDCKTTGDNCAVDSMVMALHIECPYIPYIAQ